MPGLNSIEQLRSVDWNRGYLWDLRFLPPTNPPRPFDDWFPAVDVDDTLWSVAMLAIEGPIFPMEVPKGAQAVRTVNVTFVDDVKGTVERWLSEWVNEGILRNGTSVATISECWRKMEVIRLGLDKRPIFRYEYLVIPTGNFTFTGRSESISNQYQVNFNVLAYSEDDLQKTTIEPTKNSTPAVSYARPRDSVDLLRPLTLQGRQVQNGQGFGGSAAGQNTGGFNQR